MVRSRTSLLLLSLALSIGCSTEDHCKALHSDLPSGLVLATEDAECEAIRRFAAEHVLATWPSLWEWIQVVPAQGTRFTLGLIRRLTTDDLSSFERSPSTVPCGNGVELEEVDWSKLRLSEALGEPPPERLYVSAKLQITGDLATISIFQDFDCDGELGVSKTTGRFARDLGFPLGWRVESATYAQINE